MANESKPDVPELARALAERDAARRELAQLRGQAAGREVRDPYGDRWSTHAASLPAASQFRREHQFRLLVDAVTDQALYLLDPAGCVLTWNRGAVRLTGYQVEEVTGLAFSRFYSPEDVQQGKPASLLRRALAEGRVEDQGWEIRKDGSMFWADAILSPVRDAQGALIGFVKITRDHTELRKAEEQAKVLALLIKCVVDYAIFMLDPEGCIATWNLGARRIKGYEDTEIIGQPYARFFTPEDRARGKPQQLMERAATLGHVEDEGWRVRKDGSRFWASAVLTAIRDEHGTLLGFAKVTHDLTERKRMEDALRDSEERLRAVIGNAPVVLFAADRQGVIQFAEGKGKAPIRSTVGELVGKPLPEVFGDQARIQQHLQQALAGEVVRDVLTVGGVSFEVWISPMKSGEAVCGVTGVIGVALDVTERKQLEDALKAQYEKLKELDKLKNDFVNAVSHDLRTPLTSIMGYAEFLEDGVAGPLMAGQLEFVTQIQKGSKRLEHLIDNLLDFARMEAGTFHLQVAEADLGATIAEVLESLRPQARNANLSLAADLPAESLLTPMDAARIERVLTNLVNNAIKFTPGGGRITIQACHRGDHVRCEVQDSGVGIAPADLPKLFQRFVQLEAGSSQKGGTGLGLSISKAIIVAHGGQIGVESVPGAGSTFWFTLPLVAPTAGEQATV